MLLAACRPSDSTIVSGPRPCSRLHFGAQRLERTIARSQSLSINASHGPAEKNAPDVNGNLRAERRMTPTIPAHAPECHGVDQAWRKALGFPEHSSVKSGPGPVMLRIASTGLSLAAFTVCVAPSSVPSFRRSSLTSTRMILVQPMATAARRALSPTEPPPKMAIDEPARGCERVHDGAGSGLNAAAERPHDLERHVAWNLDDGSFACRARARRTTTD